MRVTNLVLPLFLLAACAPAQVLSPEEIRDPNMRELQKKYFAELKQISVAVYNHDFPYHFYFSRTLDLSEKDQHSSDQRSIQFDRYRDQTVLKITGNYFASYSAELMQPNERARQTYQEVMLPLLEAAVPAFATADVPEAFAFEISHHVRKKMLGVSSEATENVVLILPKGSALRLMTATNAQAKQAAVSEGEAFLNAAPIELWPGFKGQEAKTSPPTQPVARQTASAPVASLDSAGPLVLPGAHSVAGINSASIAPTNAGAAYRAAGGVGTSATQPGPAARPERDSSPDALKNIQNTYQASLDRMVQELNAQAHFVRYAPPAFIPFHNGLYLQLSVTTTLPESAAGSQYKLAALAFDQHIAHLIRPALEYFKGDRGDFDGIDFSSSIRLGADKDSDGSPVAVEFMFPLNTLRAYKEFDITGQQLIDSGFVLINGERVGLDLQVAEAASR
jgi:hypothetical protein